MLKIIWVAIALCLLIAAPVSALAPDYSLVVNGMTVYSDVPLSVDGFKVLIPLRVVAEATGANVQYLDNEREVIITRPGLEVVLWPDRYSIIKNGSPILLTTPPKLINERIFVMRDQLSQILDVKAYLNVSANSIVVKS